MLDTRDIMAPWEQLLSPANEKSFRAADTATDKPTAPNIRPQQRIAVYWTENDVWWNGTYTSSRCEQTDDGRTQWASRIVYDACDGWPKPTVYYHNLAEEMWECID